MATRNPAQKCYVPVQLSANDPEVPDDWHTRAGLFFTSEEFGYRRVGPNKIFLWKDGPEPNTTSCGHLCLMTPKKETLTNPKSRRLSLNVALTRRWWGKKEKKKG